MALQTLTSSSAFPQETATNTTTNINPNTLDGRNSIPFSFLVAFLALFVTFMTVGLCARRVVYFIRLQLGLPIPEPRKRYHEIKPKKPVLWDMYPEKRGDVQKWTQIVVRVLVSPTQVHVFTYLATHYSRYHAGFCGKRDLRRGPLRVAPPIKLPRIPLRPSSITTTYQAREGVE